LQDVETENLPRRAIVSIRLCSSISIAFESSLAALSFRPRGRPTFASLFDVRAASSGKLSFYQIRPLQMLQIVFSLTPKISATYVGESFAGFELSKGAGDSAGNYCFESQKSKK
jgi:glucan phosphoethanolaminetransferase (alkaline phosphatase superfamily)